MKIFNRRAAACVAAKILVLFLLGSSLAAERDYRVLAHGLTLDSTPHVAAAIDAVEARIAAWDRAFAAARIPVRRLLSGPYGSGFLAFNRKGMDLDYLCVLDLGTLEGRSSEDQAKEIVNKISRALVTVREVNESIPDTPALYVYYPGPFGPEGWERGREAARRMVARRLDAIKEGRPMRTAFRDKKGRLVPTALFPFQVVIPVNLKVRIASNQVRYFKGMFPGLRTISVQFFFSAGIREGDRLTYLNICPLYTRFGVVIPFFDLMVNNVFLSARDVARYRERVRHLSERQVIFYHARRLFLVSGYENGAGRYLKQMKRMHQCYNSLKWAFDVEARRRIEKIFKKWLHSDWAVLAGDVVEQGEMWQEGGGQMKKAFVRAGELPRLADFLRRVGKRLGAEQAALDRLAARFASGQAEQADFAELVETGRRLKRKTGPSPAVMEGLLRLFSDKFDELGFKKVNIYGLRGGRLLLWRDELLSAGLMPSKVNLPLQQGGVKKLGGFDFEVIPTLSPGQVPLRPLLFRVIFEGPPAERFGRYYKAISWP